MVQFGVSMKCLHSIFLALLCVILNSCIDGEEEVFIEADGSARVKAVYRVPGMLFSAEDAEALRVSIEQEFGREKTLRLVTNQVENQKGKRVVILEIETDDVTAMEGRLAEHDPGVVPSKADKILHAIVGRIAVNMEGLSVNLTRKVDLRPLLEEYLGSGSASMLGDSEFRYTVHLPEVAEKSNAHEVSNGGRTLKWSHKLVECGRKPITLSMTSPMPLPWWLYVVAALLLLVMVWGAYVWIRKLRTGGIRQDTRLARSSDA